MRKLINYKNKKLKQISETVLAEENISDLLADMDKLGTVFQAYGISAVQVGELKRVFLFREKPTDNFKAAINPSIIEVSETYQLASEGCLSFPNVDLPVMRPTTVKVRYETQDRVEVEETLNGLAARVFQHENDHLNGISIADNLSTLKRDIVKKKIDKWQKKTPLSGMIYETK